MRRPGYFAIYLLLIIAQIILNNFMNFSQWFMLSILPVMVLFLSIRRSTVQTLFIAFAIGFAVDFFSDGNLGLTTVALLPVAALRRPMIDLVLGREIFLRKEELSIRRQGMLKILLLIVMSVGLYLAIFIMVDSAGTRSFGFNILKWLFSFLGGTLVSVGLVGLLTDREQWR